MKVGNAEAEYFPSVVSLIPVSYVWILFLKSQYKLLSFFIFCVKQSELEQ